MSNPIYSRLKGNQPQGGIDQMLQKFSEFKMGFTGDPKEKVQELLNSGQMSQERFNELSEIASRLQRFVK